MKTFVPQREIGNTILTHRHRQPDSVMKRLVLDFIAEDTSFPVCDEEVNPLTPPSFYP
jgi:hypothetical protein